MNNLKEKQKDKCTQEQFWFTGTSLAFIGFVGGNSPQIHGVVGIFIALVTATILIIVGVVASLLVLDRANTYKILDKEITGDTVEAYTLRLNRWPQKLRDVWKEKSAALFCLLLLLPTSVLTALICIMKVISYKK